LTLIQLLILIFLLIRIILLIIGHHREMRDTIGGREETRSRRWQWGDARKQREKIHLVTKCCFENEYDLHTFQNLC